MPAFGASSRGGNQLLVGVTRMISPNLPLWLRLVLLAGAVGLASGARPACLSIFHASGNAERGGGLDRRRSRQGDVGYCEPARLTNAPVRLKVIDSGTALEAANLFSAGKADLAVVRGDVGDLSKAQAVVVVSHVVVLLVAPPASAIDSIDKLKGRPVGVVGGEANARIVDVLSREYGLDRAKVFKDIALQDARRAIQSKEVSALLIVIPLAGKYLTLVRDVFQQGPKALPILLPINSAGAIAQAERAYESFDVPKGTLRRSPPVPEDDLTTLRTTLYLVATKKLGTDLIASLTQTIMSVRRELLAEQPIFAQITAPSTDQDAYLPLHPGAAAVYNGTQQSFMDEYGNWIYLTPMALGGAATVCRGRWNLSPQPAKVRWILSMPLGDGSERPVPKWSFQISKMRSTIFSIRSAPNPPAGTRTLSMIRP